jgi:hypothetical protein
MANYLNTAFVQMAVNTVSEQTIQRHNLIIFNGVIGATYTVTIDGVPVSIVAATADRFLIGSQLAAALEIAEPGLVAYATQNIFDRSQILIEGKIPGDVFPVISNNVLNLVVQVLGTDPPQAVSQETVEGPDDTAYASCQNQIAADLALITPADNPTITYTWLEDLVDGLDIDSADRIFYFEDQSIRLDSNLSNQVFGYEEGFFLKVLIKSHGRTIKQLDRALNAECKSIMAKINERENWPFTVSHSVQAVTAEDANLEIIRNPENEELADGGIITIIVRMLNQTENE